MKQLLISIIVNWLLGAAICGAPFFMISEVGTSAQTIGLGRVEGVYNTAGSVFENPAAINTGYNSSASIFTATVMNEVNYTALAGSQKFDFGTIGFGYMQASISGIPLTQDNGTRFIKVGSFDYLNYIAKVSYQRDYSDKISVGVSAVNYAQTFHDVSGQGINFDAGVTYQFWDDLKFSLFARNIVPGMDVSYVDGATEKLDMEFVGSARYQFEDFIYYYQVRFKGGNYLTSGAFRYQPSFLSFIAFNTGYYSDLVVEQIKAGYTFGISLLLGSIEFHYALEKSDYVEVNNKSYFSLDMNF